MHLGVFSSSEIACRLIALSSRLVSCGDVENEV